MSDEKKSVEETTPKKIKVQALWGGLRNGVMLVRRNKEFRLIDGSLVEGDSFMIEETVFETSPIPPFAKEV